FGAGFPVLRYLRGAVGAPRRHEDRNAEDGFAEPNLVAVLEVELGEGDAGPFFGRHVLVALANLLAVHEDAVAAADGADADVGGVDVEQAVVPGDRLVVLVIGQAW